MLSAAYVRAGSIATTVLVASVLTPLFAPDSITIALQVIAGVLFVVAFRHMPAELRRRMYRELRLELILGCISVLGLLGMAAFGQFVPDEMRGPVGLLWLWLPLAFLGLLMVRIVRIVATHGRRARA
jgi:hypothetical protein